jgi:hypothetical protein
LVQEGTEKKDDAGPLREITEHSRKDIPLLDAVVQAL